MRLTFPALALVFACAAPPVTAQGPASRALTLDLSVVDRDGKVMPGIGADAFEVEIGGRRRRVITAEMIPAAAAATAEGQSRQQTYFIAVDALSFSPGGSQLAIAAIRTFVQGLPAGSRVGLVTIPGGPAVEQTTDAQALLAALPALSGQRQVQRWGSLGVGPGDVVDYLAANDRTSIVQRFCGTEEDSGCPAILDQEVMVGVSSLETQLRSSLSRLVEFTNRLSEIPGRKVLVLVSAGLAISERSGNRPDAGNLSGDLADAAARSNVAFYTLLLDRVAEQGRAETGRQPVNPARERELLSRWLDQFSLAGGGALVRVQPERPADADARIARETTSFYRLTVEGVDGDRGGRSERVRVRVSTRGATVRARTTVAIPNP